MYLLSDHQKWLHCYVSLLEGTWNCSGFQDFALVTGLLDSGGVAFAWSGRLVIRHTTCILYQKDSLEVKAETIHGWFMAKINSDLDHRTVPFIWVDFGGSCCRPFWPYTQVASPGFFFHKEAEDETLEKIWFCTTKSLFFFSPLVFFWFSECIYSNPAGRPFIFQAFGPCKKPQDSPCGSAESCGKSFQRHICRKTGWKKSRGSNLRHEHLGAARNFFVGEVTVLFPGN